MMARINAPPMTTVLPSAAALILIIPKCVHTLTGIALVIVLKTRFRFQVQVQDQVSQVVAATAIIYSGY